MSSLPDDLIDTLADASTPRQAVDAFINWYQEQTVRDKRDFTREVRNLEDPVRRFVCLHLAWYMIVTDGLVEYFNAVEEDWFDEYACDALQTLDQPTSAEALHRAREVFDRFGEDFPSDMEEELHDEFFEPVEDLELQIGRWLLDEV